MSASDLKRRPIDFTVMRNDSVRCDSVSLSGLRNAKYDVHGRRNFSQSGRQVDLPPFARKGAHDAGWIEVREQLGDSRPRPLFPADGGGRHHVAATVDNWLVRSYGVRDCASGARQGYGGGVERRYVNEWDRLPLSVTTSPIAGFLNS